MKKSYSSVRGTSDFNGSSVLEFNRANKTAAKIFKLFGYEEIILPILEEKDLFAKSVGETTDIIERQIFKIEGKDVVLRPEGTAQVIRYYLANSLHKKSDFHKLFYMGAMFRGERPQKGRLRQFHHIGAEAIGSNSVYLDAEMIILSLKILDAIGIKDKTLWINSLGCKADKAKFAEIVKEGVLQCKDNLCEDCNRRVHKNPLRVLDCKKDQCKSVARTWVTQAAHPAKNYLCPKCKEEFKNLLEILKDFKIDHKSSTFLVRGLDYYTNTVFEITTSGLGSQDAIGAGGRYNNLVEFLGGPSKPAIGFALGLERILLSLGESKRKQSLDVFVAIRDDSFIKEGFRVLRMLREEGINADFDYCGKSLKGQMRSAQRKGSRVVVILGEEEAKEGTLLLKDMEKSTQIKVSSKNLISQITKLIKT